MEESILARTLSRRNFLAATTSVFAFGALSGCASSLAGDARSSARLDASAFHSARRYAKTSHGNIAYVERGAGPAALFLHGFPLNGFQWRGALERLSPYRRCIAPDFLGMGYTQVAEGQSCAPDSGGAIAQLLVAGHRNRVRTLLLTNCDAEHDSPPPALLPVIELAKQGRFVDEWLGRWHADTALARSPEGIGGMCYANSAHPTDEAIDTYFGPLLSTQQRTDNAHAYAVALERNVLAGIGPALRRCDVPTRIVWGTGDTIFSANSPKQLDHDFGHSRGVRLLEGSKLFWPEERPDVIAEEAQQLWNAWVPTNGRSSR